MLQLVSILYFTDPHTLLAALHPFYCISPWHIRHQNMRRPLHCVERLRGIAVVLQSYCTFADRFNFYRFVHGKCLMCPHCFLGRGTALSDATHWWRGQWTVASFIAGGAPSTERHQNSVTECSCLGCSKPHVRRSGPFEFRGGTRGKTPFAVACGNATRTGTAFPLLNVCVCSWPYYLISYWGPSSNCYSGHTNNFDDDDDDDDDDKVHRLLQKLSNGSTYSW